MPDLNRMLQEVQRQSSEINDKTKNLLGLYENLLREGNRVLAEERTASGSNLGLEDFIRLMQIIRRNRDVIGSLIRGGSNLRPMAAFKFIEEDIKEAFSKKTRKQKPSEKKPEPRPDINEPEPELVAEEIKNG